MSRPARFIVALATASFAACSTVPTDRSRDAALEAPCAIAPTAATDRLTPAEANTVLSEAPRRCHIATFAMKVRSVGYHGSLLYLNSENDFMSDANLALVVTPRAREELDARFGKAADRHLQGANLVVVGAARSVPIYLTSPGIVGTEYGDFGARPVLWAKAPHLTLAHIYRSYVLVESANQVRVDAPPGGVATP